MSLPEARREKKKGDRKVRKEREKRRRKKKDWVAFRDRVEGERVTGLAAA